MVQIGGDKKGKIRNVQLEKLVQVGFHDKGDNFFEEMLAEFFDRQKNYWDYSVVTTLYCTVQSVRWNSASESDYKVRFINFW